MADENQQQKDVDKPADISLSFTSIDAQMTTLLMLQRMEERQKKHGEMLRKILLHLEPETDLDAYLLDRSKHWMMTVLKSIQNDVELAQIITKSKQQE